MASKKAEQVAEAQQAQNKAYEKALKEYKKNGPDPAPINPSSAVHR